MELFIIFGSISAIIIYAFFTKHSERMARIKRGDNVYFDFEPPSTISGGKALLFGMIFAAVGLAFLIGSLVILRHYDRDMMIFALLFLFGGIAMIGYWRITRPDREMSRRIYERRFRELDTQTPEA